MFTNSALKCRQALLDRCLSKGKRPRRGRRDPAGQGGDARCAKSSPIVPDARIHRQSEPSVRTDQKCQLWLAH